MNKKSFTLIVLVLTQYSHQFNIIPTNKTIVDVTGKTIKLKWNITLDANIIIPRVYINDWKTRIGEIGITADGEKIFGERISHLWIKKNPNYYYELTMKGLVYNDANNFQMMVMYSKPSNPLQILVDNTSSISLQVRGGVDYCGNLLDNMTVYNGVGVSQTVHLCGNPKPKVTVSIGGEEHTMEGIVVDETRREYKYNITLKSPSYCGKIIKYQMHGYKNKTHESQIIPQKVTGVRYESNSTNCATVSWQQVDYGDCSSGLMYQLRFLLKNGSSVYQNVTNGGNQTKYVVCGNENLTNATSVNITAVYTDSNYKEFIGKPSSSVNRIDTEHHRSTTTTPNTTSLSPGSSSRTLTLVTVLISVLILVLIIVLPWLFIRKKQFIRKIGEKEKLRKKHTESSDVQMTEVLSVKSPSSGNNSPFIDFKEPNKKPTAIISPTPVEEVFQPCKDTIYAPVKGPSENEKENLNSESLNKVYTEINPHGKVEQYVQRDIGNYSQINDPNTLETKKKYMKETNADTAVYESVKDSPQNKINPTYSNAEPDNKLNKDSNLKVKTENTAEPSDNVKLKSKENNSNFDSIDEPSLLNTPMYEAVHSRSKNPNETPGTNSQPFGNNSNYDVVIAPEKKIIPEYAAVDMSKKQPKKEQVYDSIDGNSESQPLLNTTNEYKDVSSVVPGKSYRKISDVNYDEIDNYAHLPN